MAAGLRTVAALETGSDVGDEAADTLRQGKKDRRVQTAVKAGPPAMRRQTADAVRGIQKIAPGSETAATALKLAIECARDVGSP